MVERACCPPASQDHLDTQVGDRPRSVGMEGPGYGPGTRQCLGLAPRGTLPWPQGMGEGPWGLLSVRAARH